MSRRRGSGNVSASPVLIGAATVLVALVAVFIAYNANSGLPFVPTYTLKTEVPSAANLVEGNEVRVGGARVGTVTDIAPRRQPDGRVTALLTLKLQRSIKPLPRTSTLIIRSRSALGLKYVQLNIGPRRAADGGRVPTFIDGATIPLRNAVPRPVEIDEVLNMFDRPTRRASRVNLREFSDALAGRGSALNDAIADLPLLLARLDPVMRNLADPRTRLRRLFPALGRAAALVAPVAETQAELFGNLDTTFRALADVARPFIQESISEAPPALDEAVRSFAIQRPFLRNTQGLFHELRPGVRALSGAAPDIATALRVGTPALRSSVLLNARLKGVFRALDRFTADPRVPLGVRDLTSTASLLNPTVAALTPAQTVCNYVTLWFRNVASLLSEGDANGTWQRFNIIATPAGPNNEGGPASGPASGPNRDNFLHSNPYPNTAAPGQPRECEAANEDYAPGRTVIGNVAGNQGTAHDATTPSNP